MKLQYISDIHFEFFQDKLFNIFYQKIYPVAEYLILAGDISTISSNTNNQYYIKFLKYCSENWKHIFIITGNHEYYNSTIEHVNNTINDICKDFYNIHFLNNSSIIIDNYKFIGSTLWSNIPNQYKYFAKQKLNDFIKIYDFNVDTYNNLNSSSVNFIKKEIENTNNLNIIIITHHVPSFDLIDQKYIDSDINYCFCNNLNELFNNNNIKCWIYGHTHTPLEKEINHIKFCCNPIGYIGENKFFKLNKYIEI